MTPLGPAGCPSADEAEAPTSDETMDASEAGATWLTKVRRAAAELARRFPPMTADQAALVRRTLRAPRR